MILTCPECATRYLVDPAALAPDGRQVRCAKCQHSWWEQPPADMPKRIDVEPLPRVVRPIPPGSNLPALVQSREKNSRAAGWLVFAVALILALALLWFGRTRIAAVWPPAEVIYSALGVSVAGPPPLAVRDLKSATITDKGATVLTVSGKIVNKSALPQTTPPLKIVLRDAAHKQIYQWVYTPPAEVIKPGGQVAFSTKLNGPPAGAQSLRIFFLTDDGPAS